MIKDEQTGLISIYAPGESLPIEHLKIPIVYDENADSVAAAVNSIINKVHAIDELMESVAADLGLIELEHIDDNGKELAQRLKHRFQKIESEFYWQAIEREAEEGEGWMASSLLFMVGLLAARGTQKLVMPQLRQTYAEIVKDEDISDAEKDAEFADWTKFIRQDFSLSDKFI